MIFFFQNGAATVSTAEVSQPVINTANTTAPTQGLLVPATQPQQQQQQQQQHIQQYFQISDEIQNSLDLLGDQQQKQTEFYTQEFTNGEYNEAKPLADLLINPNYTQDSTAANQLIASSSFNSSQMIAQAYSHAQQMSTAYTPQVVSSTNAFPQVSANMNVVVNSAQGQDANGTIQASAQQQQQTIEVNGQQVQAQAAVAGQIGAQQVQNFAEAYATQVGGDAATAAAVHQQQQVVTFSLAGGQNMIIASPHTQQAGQNFVIAPQGQSAGQNIVIAAPGQQTAMPAGNYIVKAEGDDLSQNIVLTQQNLQHALGQNVVLTQDGLATTATGENVVLTTTDGQQRQQTISAARQIQQTPQQAQQQMLAQTNIPIQTGNPQIGQVSLVLPQVNSLFPQMQTTLTPNNSVNPQTFVQLFSKMDKMINMVKESQNTLFEMNKRVERIENHLFPQGGAPSAQPTPAKSAKTKSKAGTPGSVATPSTTSTSAAVTKASLKAALSSYLTISEYSATDELKRSDSNSDLFIPVGTVSMSHGQEVVENSSELPETASSTVQELPTEQELVPVVLGNMAAPAAPSTDINVPIVDSQSGIAVTVYDEGSENQKYELGPGSSKEPNARFSNTSSAPKTVILDPRFWDILVEDFQKNMSSDQIVSAMAATRKPLVRSIGTSEISICSTVLKEAESACQGRRERLAKELVFRIFTLGEVYDRNVSGVFYINGKKMENKNKALDPAKMAAIHYLVMKYPPSVVDNPRLERLVWKNCVDRINDALRRIYNWIHKIVDVNNIMDKLPTDSIMMH